ncbi:hypothetical protein Tco_1030810 [Tanacetum coccineum]|uniref:Reverse transcriptase domain-containing protein n=1 Tax=Tanacetum coccineum TaxID=301880 RepID=A0ABQ5G8Y7_9ASTR
MAQHKFDTPIEGRIVGLEDTLNKFIRESSKKQKEIKGLIWDIKKGYDHDFKAQASSIKQLEVQVGKIAEIVQNKNSGSLPSATKTNPQEISSKEDKKSGDIEEDSKVPIILGRPFLAIAHAMIDVFNKKISLEVGEEKITFNIEKSMKFSTSADDTCHSFDLVDLTAHDHVQDNLPRTNTIHFCSSPLKDINPTMMRSEASIYGTKKRRNLLELRQNYDPNVDKNPTLFAASVTSEEKHIPKMKELPSHLEYAFLDGRPEFPVIISSLLSKQEKTLLLQVLTKHKTALAWKVADIKGISSSFCTHKILMDDNYKHAAQSQ